MGGESRSPVVETDDPNNIQNQYRPFLTIKTSSVAHPSEETGISFAIDTETHQARISRSMNLPGVGFNRTSWEGPLDRLRMALADSTELESPAGRHRVALEECHDLTSDSDEGSTEQVVDVIILPKGVISLMIEQIDDYRRYHKID